MRPLPATFASFVALTAVGCTLAQAAEPEPRKLIAITKVRVVMQDCRSRSRDTRKTIEIEDSTRVNALVSEFEALRSRPKGIRAAKHSCSTDVTFLQGARVTARIHVFPCDALEHAPVEGKRYFTYKEGLNRLPELTRVVGVPSKERECK